MRQDDINGRPVLVLREPKPSKPEPHRCVVEHGDYGPKSNIHAIIQCECGKRYRCRQSRMIDDRAVWVRRILPWPPRNKNWP